MKTNWWLWGCKLWLTISLLARIASSGNASAQTFSDIIFNNASQCGLSLSGGYYYGNKNNEDILSNTNTNSHAWQIITTLNTNPCTNQSELEKIRQESESKRELIRQDSEKQREIIRQENEKQREAIRTYSQIINTCINARVQAIQKDMNPDIICNITQIQNNFGTILPAQKN
ncbi:hypothetical protein ACSQ6I_12950 [Anabaena sp. WFMT]|uniref:hypothetical protein n=1 Tax=Anabaena sp. WFMT TaxID=3449730 RepID=UPI003F26E93A